MFAFNSMLGITLGELELGASHFMLNSPIAWDKAYDDTHKNRAIMQTIALWPKFQEFVERSHALKASEEPWDPLSIEFDELVLE